MGPPNVRTVQGLWGDAEERRAERDSHTIPVYMPTGPLPHPIDFNRPEYQVRRANALTPNASKGLGISPRSPRMHLPPALDIMQRLGPPPMTTVLAGPRSPRRLMPVAQGPPPPGAAAPLSARPSTPRGMQAKVDAFYSKYTTVEKAAKVPSGGVIVRDGSVGAYHRPKTPKGAVSNEELAAAHKLLQNFMETKFKSLRKCFRKIDCDNSGYCSRAELKYMLNAMFNLNISGAVLDRLVDLIDYDGNDSVSFAEFCRVFTSMDILSMKDTLEAGVHGPADERVNSVTINPDADDVAVAGDEALTRQVRDEVLKRYTSLKVAFKLMDSDNSGYLDGSEIAAALDKWKIPYTRERLSRILNEGDFNGDGKIHYVEFVDMLSKDTPLLRAIAHGMKHA